MPTWKTKWDSGYLWERLFNDNGQLIAEVHQQWGDEELFDARICLNRPYTDLGEFDSVATAKKVIDQELQRCVGGRLTAPAGRPTRR